MQQIKAIVKGPYEPKDNQVLWIDTSNPDKIAEKVFEGGEWKVVQQDYTKFQLSNDFDELTNTERKKIQEFHRKGILFDVIFINRDGVQSHIIADDIDMNDQIVVYTMADAGLGVADVSIE